MFLNKKVNEMIMGLEFFYFYLPNNVLTFQFHDCAGRVRREDP